MGLFGKNKNPLTIYTCPRGEGKINSFRGVYEGYPVTEVFLRGVLEYVKNCEKKNGPCPEGCEIQLLLRTYGRGGPEAGG
jgi:hypothetical protein